MDHAAIAVAAAPNRRASPVRLTVRFTHALQLSVQFLVFCYWSLYWPDARDYFRQLGLLAVIAYLVDGMVSMARYRSWNVGVGPLPVVLSASLFVWFTGETAWVAYVMIACGVASKHLLQRGGGRHLFNPSAFGVCVIAIPCILMPHRLGEIDVSHHLNTPPNMLEVILLLASFAHWRVPVVLISVSAALASRVLHPLMPLVFAAHPYTPAVDWAPIYLGITLLVTDPATTPRRPMAQVLFGAAYMTLFAFIGSALDYNGMNFWAKMLPIPTAQLLRAGLRSLRGGAPAPGVVVAGAALQSPPRARLGRFHGGVDVRLQRKGRALRGQRPAPGPPHPGGRRRPSHLRRQPGVLYALQFRRRDQAMGERQVKPPLSQVHPDPATVIRMSNARLRRREATLEDLLAIPEDERFHELINGELVEKAAPAGEHGHYWILDPAQATLLVYRWHAENYLEVIAAQRGDRARGALWRHRDPRGRAVRRRRARGGRRTGTGPVSVTP